MMCISITKSNRVFRPVLFKPSFRYFNKKPPWSLLFFGNDKFSLYSLHALTKEYESKSLIKKLDVVTNIKTPSNPVHRYCLKSDKIKLHSWPTTVNKNEYDVGIVVSFGHLIPENIIDKFVYGILNIHASLLPKWRGAAPIIHALANGDTETGVTIMRIHPHHYDVGEIIAQSKIDITPDERMPELYEKLGILGAENLIHVLQHLPEKLLHARTQPNEGVVYAPKVSQQFGRIRFESMTATQIYNLERALTEVFPLTASWLGIPVKLISISQSSCRIITDQVQPGSVFFDKLTKCLEICCADNTYIAVEKVGVAGKKIMKAVDFNNGYIVKEPINKRYFT